MTRLIKYTFMIAMSLIFCQCSFQNIPNQKDIRYKFSSNNVQEGIIRFDGFYVREKDGWTVFDWIKFYPDGFCRIGYMSQGIYNILGDTISIDCHYTDGLKWTISYRDFKIIDSCSIVSLSEEGNSDTMMYRFMYLDSLDVIAREDILHDKSWLK